MHSTLVILRSAFAAKDPCTLPALLLLSTICIGPSARKKRGPHDDNSQIEFHFGNGCGSGVPLFPSRSIGISDIAQNHEVIYGAQQLRGKILSRKDLGPAGRYLLTLLSLWQ